MGKTWVVYHGDKPIGSYSREELLQAVKDRSVLWTDFAREAGSTGECSRICLLPEFKAQAAGRSKIEGVDSGFDAHHAAIADP